MPGARSALAAAAAFPEPEFIQRSILPSIEGEKWRDRYYNLKPSLYSPPRVMPDELGPLPKDVSPFERCNLWLLYTALAMAWIRCVLSACGMAVEAMGRAAHSTCITRSSKGLAR